MYNFYSSSKAWTISLFSLTLVNCMDESKYMIDHLKKIQNTDSLTEPINFSKIKLSPKERKEQEWIRKVRMLQQMNEGDTLILFNTKNKKHLSSSQKKKEYDSSITAIIERNKQFPSNEEFEYSEEWRIEAYKSVKNYTKHVINKKPNCKIIAEGNYHPNFVRYLGGQTYLVKIYFVFNCNEDYNNPSNFWAEATFTQGNSWHVELKKQRFTD